jgi:hypothetical protein
MAMNACETYRGNVESGTLVRNSIPTSPMSDPSRASTIEVWGGRMIRHAGIVSARPAPVWASSGAKTPLAQQAAVIVRK